MSKSRKSDSANAAGVRSFRVDARMLLSLGRESIKDHTTALVELVKNAYDADALNVEVELPGEEDNDQFIRIADDGHGMDSADLNDKWLRIGFSEKKKYTHSAKGRRKTGEKGIGRLSADRLGSQLELRSRSVGGLVGVQINWDDFDVDGADISTIDIQELEGAEPRLPEPPHSRSETGTEIVIRGLRQEWTQEDISNLEVELSTLIPPEVANSEFQIWLRTAQGREFEQLQPPFQAEAELEFSGSFDTKGQLTYTISERPLAGGKRHQIAARKTPWAQLHGSKESSEYLIGKIGVNLKFFLRAGVKIEGFTLDQLKDYLDTYGGVRIYRDNVRVKPYGDPDRSEGDWLGLSERKSRNPAGASRKDFRIAGNQLVGSVFIGRDTNPHLKDSAAREGLVNGEGLSQLRAAVYACVGLLETFYHQKFSANKASEAAVNQDRLPTVVGDIKAGIAEVRKDLELAHRQNASDKSSSRLLSVSVARIEEVAKKIALAERGIEELANQATVYRGLATVGISSAVFGHETESALAQAKMSTGIAYKAIDREPPHITMSLSELEKAKRSIERVSVWGQFALARVKKDKRRRIKADLAKIARDLVEEMRPLFNASTIQIDCKASSPIELRMFPMDVEALILNLLTNAYHAAGQSKKGREVFVTIRLEKKNSPVLAILTVEDSGPGITREHMDQIWAPLFSTRVDTKGRPTGTGLGLTIVKSVANEMGAVITVSPKGTLGGAKFEVAFPVGG